MIADHEVIERNFPAPFPQLPGGTEYTAADPYSEFEDLESANKGTDSGVGRTVALIAAGAGATSLLFLVVLLATRWTRRQKQIPANSVEGSEVRTPP